MKKRVCYLIVFVLAVVVYTFMQNIAGRTLKESIIVMLAVLLLSNVLIEKKFN